MRMESAAEKLVQQLTGVGMGFHPVEAGVHGIFCCLPEAQNSLLNFFCTHGFGSHPFFKSLRVKGPLAGGWLVAGLQGHIGLKSACLLLINGIKA